MGENSSSQGLNNRKLAASIVFFLRYSIRNQMNKVRWYPGEVTFDQSGKLLI